MNEHTSAAGNDIGTLIDDARALMAATADVTGDKVNEARKRLAAALERGLERGRDACEQVHEKALHGARTAEKAVHDHPYEAIALGIGLGVGAGTLLGFLVARAFPSHRN